MYIVISNILFSVDNKLTGSYLTCATRSEVHCIKRN